MVYLIVGVDRSTFARWHTNVMARDAATAAQIAGARAEADGVALVVAAAIGPYSALVDVPTDTTRSPLGHRSPSEERSATIGP